MSRTSINPYCPYCRVRHDGLKISRCRELAEQEDAADDTGVATCPSACAATHPGREHDETEDGCTCLTLCAMGPTCPGANAGLDRGCWRTKTGADDTGVDEREWCQHGMDAQTCPWAATPDADATPPPGDGDVEAMLTVVLAAAPGTPTLTCRKIAEAVLTSDWLAARDAEVGERIARAIDANREQYTDDMPRSIASGWIAAMHNAASIAREQATR